MGEKEQKWRPVVSFTRWLIWGAVMGFLAERWSLKLVWVWDAKYAVPVTAVLMAVICTPIRRLLWGLPKHGRLAGILLAAMTIVAIVAPTLAIEKSGPWVVGILAVAIFVAMLRFDASVDKSEKLEKRRAERERNQD